MSKFLESITTPDEHGKTLQDYMRESMDEFAQEAENLWTSMSEADRLKLFFAVMTRIYKGDVKDRGSYRHMMYEVFGFDFDSYTVGMECGYMKIHNLIQEGLDAKSKDEEIARLREACKEALQANQEITASLVKIKASIESARDSLGGKNA